MIWLENNNEPHNKEHHGCCGSHKHSVQEGGVREESIDGMKYFFYDRSGESEVMSLADDSSPKQLEGYSAVNDAYQWSLQSKATFTAFGVFAFVWLWGFVGVLPAGLAFVVNQLVLAIIIAPYFYRMSRFAKGCLLAMIIAVGLFFVIPALVPVSLLSLAFDTLTRGQSPSWQRVAGISVFQLAVFGVATLVSPWFWLMAPLSGVRSMLQSSNLEVGCDFALTLVVLLTMVSAGAMAAFGGVSICLHDAVLAAMMVYAKDVGIHKGKRPRVFSYHAEGKQAKLIEEIKVLDSLKGTLISLDQLDPRKLYESGELIELREGVDAGHEVSYSVESFREGVLPKGSIVQTGAIVGQVVDARMQSSKTPKKVVLKSELDNVQMYLVPGLMVLCSVSVITAGLISGSAMMAVMVGLQSLLAACPCIFMAIPYLEQRLAARFSQLKAGVSFNFKNKILSAVNLPWSMSHLRYGFDRTRTTHFPDKSQDGREAYTADENAMAYIAGLVKEGFGESMFFISGSAARFIDAYKEDLRKAGLISPDIKTGGEFSSCCAKKAQYDKIIVGSSNPVAWFCDGDNDIKVAKAAGIAVGIDPVSSLQDKVTVTMMRWPAAKEVDKILEYAIKGQKFASILLKQAVAILVGAVLFPVICLSVTSTLAPMYSSCAIMLGGLATLLLEVEAVNKLASTVISAKISHDKQSIDPASGRSFSVELLAAWNHIFTF